MAKASSDRMAARANEQPLSDPVERLHRRAERLGTVATGLKKLADAEAPLYKSLDDAQKHRAASSYGLRWLAEACLVWPR
jgi:hypothetical protein